MAKVLVADDSATIRGVAESLLRHNGYEVVSVSDGAKALALAKSQNPDLIFLDYLMPDKDGLAVCRELRADARLRNIPVVMLLGAAEMKEAEKFLAAGASDCLFKPFVPKDFIEKAQKFLSPFSQSTALAQDTGKLATNALLEEALSSAAKEEHLNLNDLMGQELTGQEEDTTGKIPTVPPLPAKPLNALEDKERWGKSNADDMTIKLYDTNKNIKSSQAKTPQKSKPAGGSAAHSTGSVPTSRAKSDSDKLKLEVDKDSLVLSSNPFGLGNEDLEFSSALETSQEEPHDFDWFMKEMQKESATPGSKGKTPNPAAGPAPVAPAPARSPDLSAPSGRKETSEELKLKVEEMGTSRLGYERFINEFKKEMQKLEGEEKPVYGETKIDPKAVVEAQQRVTTSKVKADPPELLETEPPVPPVATAPAGSPATDEMVNALITAVAKEIAVKISSQLDRKEIARLLEQKLSKIAK